MADTGRLPHQGSQGSKVQTSTSGWPKHKDLLEELGRMAGLLIPFVGIAYAAGLIITNAELSVRYAVVSFTLNRPHYIVVGAMWILLTAVVAQLVYTIALGISPRPWTRFPARMWRWARFLVAGM
jgi:hypothetical protein